MMMVWRVSCLDEDGVRIWATSKTFKTQDEAKEYAMTVNFKRDPRVVHVREEGRR